MLPMPEVPPEAPLAGDERTMLETFLDFQRGVVLRKVAELDDEGLRRRVTLSGLSLLGLLKHLAYVERWWFRAVFAGEEVPFPWTDDDPDADWHPDPTETADQIRGLYEDEVRRAREIVARASLDDVAARPRNERDEGPTLRWILFHMLEEYARHLGHADIMRELVDGRTGFEG
jgi:uncharacterized damage-inducible protein DinB